MRRKIMLVLIAATCALSACDTPKITASNFREQYLVNGYYVNEWIDPQTGVTYWVTSEGAICPRYEDNGELMIQKD